MRAWSVWRRFWFEADPGESFAWFRRLIGAILLVAYLSRSLDLEFFYSESGLARPEDLVALFGSPWRWTLLTAVHGRAALWLLDGGLLSCLLLLAAGLRARWVAIAAYALHLSFLHRNMAVVYGMDYIASFYLFFLCLADPRPAGSVPPGSDFTARLGSMAYRLCQVQLCVIYAYSGLKKLKGATWWSGEALWYALANPELARWDFGWVAWSPGLVAALTYLTLAWEIYFPALIWFPRLRRWMLAGGVLLHAMIAVALGIPFFALVMASTYVFFLEPGELEALRARFAALPRRLAMAAPSAPSRGDGGGSQAPARRGP